MDQDQKSNKIDPNLIIAIGVLIASFAALFVYMRQASIMSKQTEILLEQTKASAWPHLTIELYKGYSTDGLRTYKYVISNKGTGPAIIEKTIITYDDQAIQSWGEFYKVLQVPDSLGISHSNDNIHQRVLASNEKLELIDWSNHPNSSARTNLMEYIFKRADKIGIEICYASIHGDKWRVKRLGFQTDLEEIERKKVDSCGLDDVKNFRQ